MSDNPKLSIIPLTEVVFEMRYAPLSKDEMTSLSSAIRDRLTEQYPDSEPISAPILPPEIPEAANMVRNRFKSKNGKNLYQIGTGVISVNTLNYQSFYAFFDQIKSVIEAHASIGKIKHVTRLGLRYINKINEVDDMAAVTKLSITPPNFPGEMDVWYGQMLYSVSGGGKVKLMTQLNTSAKELYLDIDCFKDGPLPYETSIIFDWIDSAHDDAYSFFKESLTTTYFDSIS